MHELSVDSSMIKFPSKAPRGFTEGFLAQPTGTGKYPAVIVIQEIWGLNDQIKGLANKLAVEGYVALAPDLFEGKILSKLEDGRKIREQISQEMMLTDIQSAFAYLKTLPNVYPKKIGSVGYCMGGGLSILIACTNPELAASVVFYGRNPSPIDLVKNIHCPVMGNYAGADQGITEADVKLLMDTLAKHGKTFDIKIYPGAPHGFANETRESYRPEAARDAWKRTLDFYSKYLKG